MYVVTVSFKIREGREANFIARVHRQALDSLTRESDCHRFDVCVGHQDPSQVFLYEIYKDAAAFRAHLETSHFKEFDREVAAWTEEKSVGTWTLLSIEEPAQ